MRTLIVCSLIACGSLTAQQSPGNEITQSTPWLEKLRADLFAVMTESKINLQSLTRQTLRMAVTDDFMALTEKAHEPPESLVKQFASELTAALSGKGISDRRAVRRLTTDIQKVLQSAGTSTSGFHETVDDAQKVLVALGVSTAKAQELAGLLGTIGEKVRGPQDLGILPLQ